MYYNKIEISFFKTSIFLFKSKTCKTIFYIQNTIIKKDFIKNCFLVASNGTYIIIIAL
jgi:hypothetical protein